jgi:hypothetical protein
LIAVTTRCEPACCASRKGRSQPYGRTCSHSAGMAKIAQHLVEAKLIQELTIIPTCKLRSPLQHSLTVLAAPLMPLTTSHAALSLFGPLVPDMMGGGGRVIVIHPCRTAPLVDRLHSLIVYACNTSNVWGRLSSVLMHAAALSMHILSTIDTHGPSEGIQLMHTVCSALQYVS